MSIFVLKHCCVFLADIVNLLDVIELIYNYTAFFSCL
jgi:hypothetical protein